MTHCNARSQTWIPENVGEPRLHALRMEELPSGLAWHSTLFNDVLSGTEAAVHFVANNAHYTRGYYLTDGIYPDWPVFVKSFQFPNDEKKRRFKLMQEAARKDVERAFGVLQARWGIIKGSSRLWKQEHMSAIMFTCIILHNMIIGDEGETGATFDGDGSEGSSSLPQTQSTIWPGVQA
ncbi:uncharacterized protein LOC130998766 [Salvia miltiorrhiza]|uniref:uncharacterized protein LOC130998766 n=1 Tax=Salvia miltiorrhiza TaxID=226208 RepID=UPI0025AD67D7|nr:uncharacterized protein LOC130998766 [Salvia miltiorrhiza]